MVSILSRLILLYLIFWKRVLFRYLLILLYEPLQHESNYLSSATSRVCCYWAPSPYRKRPQSKDLQNEGLRSKQNCCKEQILVLPWSTKEGQEDQRRDLVCNSGKLHLEVVVHFLCTKLLIDL